MPQVPAIPNAEKAAAEQTEEATVLLSTAESLAIETTDQFESAAQFLQRVKGQAKRLEELRTSITRPINEALRAVNGLFKPPADMLARAERTVKQALADYQVEVERRQREAIARVEAERQAEHEAAAIERAAQLEAQGEPERAADVMNAAMLPENAPPPLVVPAASTPHVVGLQTRKAWKYRVADLDKVPRTYLMVNDALLSALARSAKANAQVPGIEFFEETIVASASR